MAPPPEPARRLNRSGERWSVLPGWTRKQRNAAVFGPALLMAVLAASVLFAMSRYRDARDWVGHTRNVLAAAQATLDAAQDAETGQRGYLLTGDSAYLTPYRSAERGIGADTAQLRDLTSDNPTQRSHLDALGPLLRAKFAELDSTVRLRAAGSEDAAIALVHADTGRVLMDSIRSRLRAITDVEERLLARRQREESQSARLLILVVVVGALLTAMLASLTNRLLAGASERHLAQASQLAAQANELADANEQLQEQQVELERQAEQLHEQQVELETSNEQLHERATELESQTTELESQADELLAANEALNTTNAELARTIERLEASESRAQSLAMAEQHAREAADIANRAKSQFLSTMSHELRTPLNGIAGHAQLIDMGIHGPVTKEQRAALARIMKAQQYLLSLINDVLNLSRIEAGKVEYDVRATSLMHVIADVVPMIEPQLAAKGMTLTLDGEATRDGAPPLMVLADRDRLRQVLLNLLSNSTKFTPEGGRVGLTVGVHPEQPECVTVAVHDTGIGIPEEQLATVFEPFVQVHRQVVGPELSSLLGTGLGLTISRDLMRGMGGEIEVESVVDAGSTFTIVLRRAGE